jgi:hypothetical protein
VQLFLIVRIAIVRIIGTGDKGQLQLEVTAVDRHDALDFDARHEVFTHPVIFHAL